MPESEVTVYITRQDGRDGQQVYPHFKELTPMESGLARNCAPILGIYEPDSYYLRSRERLAPAFEALVPLAPGESNSQAGYKKVAETVGQAFPGQKVEIVLI